jgi:hypothetical protein
MIGHTGFSVSDYAITKALYAKALTPLGHTLIVEATDQRSGQPAGAFGIGDKPNLWIGGNGKLDRPVHVAIVATDRRTVDGFYAAALAASGRDNGPPGLRHHYHPNY